MPPKKFIDETGKIDPSHPPENVGEQYRARVRRDYGLPAPKPKDLNGAWQIADAASEAATEAAGGQDRLDEALREINDDRPLLDGPTDQEEGRIPYTIGDAPNDVETAHFLNSLADEGVTISDQELTDLWRGKRYGSLEPAFDDVRSYVAKRASKELRRANVGPGAAASTAGRHAGGKDRESLARELDEIHSGKRGSPSSPKNSLRRKQIREALRHG